VTNRRADLEGSSGLSIPLAHDTLAAIVCRSHCTVKFVVVKCAVLPAVSVTVIV
jgi:hypothetical protein